MAETIGSVGCDGCDGFLDIKDAEEKNELLTIEIQSEAPINSNENPSHPSQVDAVSVSPVTDATPDPSHSTSNPTLPFEFEDELKSIG